MTTIYRVIEHKDDPTQEYTLNCSIYGLARSQGVSEIYQGETKPTILEPRPYLPASSGVDTQLSHKILVWFEGEWWLTDNPEQEFGVPEWYIDLPTLPNCPGEEV